MKEYIVGRKPGCDIMAPGNALTVSGRHLRIRETPESGVFEISDLGSSNGTFSYQDGGWVPVTSTVRCHADTPLVLGNFETTIRRLLPAEAAAALPPERSAKKHTMRDEHGNVIYTNNR